MQATEVKLIPKISEKAISGTPDNVNVFLVPRGASKDMIAKAVEAQYSVKVATVRTVVVKGKAKRSFRRRLQPLAGKRADLKKAYVTLKEGKIEMVGEV